MRAVDCDNQIDMVNREKVEDFCKAAEKEEQGSSRYCCCILMKGKLYNII